MSDIEVTHEVDGIDFICTVVPDAGTASTFMAGAVKVYAQKAGSGEIYTGTVSIVSALVLHCTFASGSLPVGIYLVQVIGTPLGYAPQTIDESTWQVRKSLGPA